MAERVAEAVGTAGTAIAIQAGTGTGKSIAYLTPIVNALAENRIERAIIATATIALQDQLLSSDLPTTVTALEADVSAAVLKGRSNYLCVQRLAELNEAAVGEQQQLLAGTDAQSYLPAVNDWADETSSGDREELVPAPPAAVWRAISVGPDECPGAARCPKGGECFAENARNTAAAADIVVTNHHFYGLHMASEGALLPPHDVVVFDEAHHLSDVISATSGAELSGGRFRNIARRIRNLLTDSDDIADLLIRSADDLPEEIRSKVGQRTTITAETMAVLLAGRTRGESAIKELRRVVKAAESEGGSLDTKTATRVERALRMLTSLIDDIDIVINAEPDSTVLWVDGSPGNPVLKATPIDVAPLCENWLWTGQSVVLTSATLPSSIGVSLGRAELSVDEVPSPFDYEELGLLYCPLHLPLPKDPSYPEQSRAEIRTLVEAAGGRSLCLFTSYRAMEGAAEFLEEELDDINVFVQGTESKAELLRSFRDTERSVLLATMSFWQGVDLPGDDLTLVTIDRLPFPRPDDPVLSARRDRLGSAAFRTIDLPRASTLLAQAAGRLVRRGDDRGVVAVLDKRLAVNKSYRWDLIRALPPFKRTKDLDEVCAFLRNLDDG